MFSFTDGIGEVNSTLVARCSVGCGCRLDTGAKNTRITGSPPNATLVLTLHGVQEWGCSIPLIAFESLEANNRSHYPLKYSTRKPRCKGSKQIEH